MKRLLIFLICFTLIFMASVSVNASGNNNTICASGISVADGIDEDIYALLESYKNETYKQDVLSIVNSKRVFKNLLATEETDGTTNLYEIKKVGDTEKGQVYDATRLTIFLEKEDQGQNQGVVVFCRIRYEEMVANDGETVDRLWYVKGGVVQSSTDYFCEGLRFRWACYGRSYNGDGTYSTVRSEYISYPSTYDVFWPEIGVTYSRFSTAAYFYLAEGAGYIAGWNKARIMLKHSNSYNYDLEVNCGITG